MCNSIENVKLYVEKYSHGNLVLDFIDEKEFLHFAHNGDYTEGESLEHFSPTMLHLHNVTRIHLAEGDIFTIPMAQLIEYKINEEELHANNIQNSDKPYNIFMTFSDGSWLEELFYSGRVSKNNRLKNQLVEYVKGNWQSGTPCALNELSDEIDVEVVDVGQGSTNLIRSNKLLTLFDFGANILASKSELESIADKIVTKFNKLNKMSLIISHWDCDHYNLLTVLDDSWLSEFNCVFFPAEIIGLTSKQVARRLLKKCKYTCTFKSPSVKGQGATKIVPIISKAKYSLFIGEKSKSINQSGLALAIKSANDVTIFGADHSNKQLWECIHSYTTGISCDRLNIVVPHHGDKSDKLNSSNLNFSPGIAAISVGKNTSKHPNQGTIDNYENLGFEVKRTDWERENILIKMR